MLKIIFQQQNLKLCKKKTSKKFFKNCNFPIVVKADGLAAGKGVTICKTKKQVIKISKKYLKENLNHQKKLI